MTIMTSLGTVVQILFVDIGRTLKAITNSLMGILPAKIQPGYRKQSKKWKMFSLQIFNKVCNIRSQC